MKDFVLRTSCLALALLGMACGDDAKKEAELEHSHADAGPDGAAPHEAGADDAGLDAGHIERDAGPDSAAAVNQDAGADGGDALKSVTIRFKAKVGESDFACGETFTGQGSSAADVQPKDFRFYVQDLRLINAAGDEVPVQMEERSPWQTPEVALIDFENAEGLCSGNAEVNTVITGKVPAGDYTGIAFANGVPEVLNHANPAAVPAPLQAPGVSWNWLMGFRFLIAEVKQPADDAGTGGTGLFHLGSTGCMGDVDAGSISCQKPNRTAVKFASFDVESDFIVADIGAIFADTDLSGMAMCHSSPMQSACAALFENVGVNFADGAPLATQSAFRVE
jgi:uncharacterized repeat protein (TIGR04052 family)